MRTELGEARRERGRILGSLAGLSLLSLAGASMRTKGPGYRGHRDQLLGYRAERREELWGTGQKEDAAHAPSVTTAGPSPGRRAARSHVSGPSGDPPQGARRAQTPSPATFYIIPSLSCLSGQPSRPGTTSAGFLTSPPAGELASVSSLTPSE